MIPRIERVNAGCSVVKIAFAFSVNKRTVRIVDAAIICGFASSCVFGYAVGNVACRHIADGAEHCGNNIWCKARLAAAETNDRLRSREGAAELIGISPNMLAKYENDLCKCIPVESVVMMADVYNEPSLLNYYCTHECMIGKTRIPEYEKKPIEQIALQMLYMMRGMDKTKDDLLEITADGVIDDDERPKLAEILKSLDEITKVAGELRIYAEKNLGITGVIR